MHAVRLRWAQIVILSGASRCFILSRGSRFSIPGSGRAVEESLFGVTNARNVGRATAFEELKLYRLHEAAVVIFLNTLQKPDRPYLSTGTTG